MKPILHGGQRLLSLLILSGGAAAFVATAYADKPAASGDITTYSAQATAVRVEGARGMGPIIIADTGAIASAGGSLDASDSNVNIQSGALTVAHADAQADGSGPESSTAATTTNFHVDIAMTTGNI